MTGLGAGLILLFLFLQTGSCNYAEILWGQCYAFCLTQHESRLQVGANVDHGITIKKCRRDKVCKWCLHACERPREEYQYAEACLTHCQKTRPKDNVKGLQACNDSCAFIGQTFSVKYGSCPLVVNDDGGDEDNAGGQSCRDKCQRDLDCDHMLKCCTSGCGSKCLRVVEWNAFPPVPAGLKFKPRPDGSTMVEWEKSMPESSKLVLYVLRWWCSYTDVMASVTTKLRLKLKGYGHTNGLQPGRACYFMLAAINEYGSQGFSAAKLHTKRLLRPSQPGNLETFRSKLHNNKVDVTIQWQPPIYTDNLPISRYLVLWSDPLPKAIPSYERRHMHNKTLDGDKTIYTITGLEPGTVYFVQVRAVVNWKRRSIKGEPVSTYIETYAIPQTADLESDIQEEAHAKSAIYNITVSSPAFVQSQLKAWVTWHLHPGSDVVKYMLHWVLDYCAEEAEHRKTRDRLETEATTHIRIHTVNYVGEMDEGRRERFKTPPCMETRGAEPNLCPDEVVPPLSPVDISLRFTTSSGCSCQVVVTWVHSGSENGNSYSHTHYDSMPESMWNIIWGQSRPPPGSSSKSGPGFVGFKSSPTFQEATIVYNTSPYETQVPGRENKACLTYLESSKHYTVQIIGQTGKIKGAPAIFHFITPDYMLPCYSDFEIDDPDGETDENNLMESSTAEADSSLQTSGSPSLPCTLIYHSLFITLMTCFLVMHNQL